MARKGENIYKRKDGRWEGRYIQNRSETGKARYGYIYGKTYKDVKNRLAIAKANVEEKTINIVPNTITFEEAANKWLDDISCRIKLSTANKYQNILNSYLIPEFGKTNLIDITQEVLETYTKNLFARGGFKKNGLSSKTVSDIISVYRSTIKYARSKNFLVSSDGSGLYIKRNINNLRILSVSEQNKLINYLLENNDLCNLGILLALNTGIRIGELCALRWQDISFEDKVIHINKTMQRMQVKDEDKKTKIIVTSPKSTCSIRDIPIPNHILIMLNDYKNNSGYFLTGSKTKYIEPRTMENKLKKITKECNIDNLHFHSLRHTFATRCIELDFDIKCLSEILGHSSVSITLNRYVHPTIKLKAHHMNKLSALFSVK